MGYLVQTSDVSAHYDLCLDLASPTKALRVFTSIQIMVALTTCAVCLDMYRVSHESRLQTGLQSEALDSIIK